MQPDLFAGGAQRDDSHRILARLANGGHVPTVARQWHGWHSVQRARMAAVVALLAVVAAAWVWLQDVGAPEAHSTPAPVAMVKAPAISGPQAATIVNEPTHALPSMQLPPAAAVAVARPEPRFARAHPAKPALPQQRAPRSDAPAEGDEDVTLLTAMLKHANGKKPAPTPPKD